MNTYFGGGDGRVGAVENGKARWLGKFSWGTNSAESAGLARALLLSMFRDKQRAERLYRRFMYRTVATWVPKKPWVYSGDELLAVVRDIELAEQEMAPMRAQIARETPRIAMEPSVPGAIGEDIPDIVNNQRKRK